MLEPGLECSNCNKIKADTGRPRLCDRPSGCPVQELASDLRVNAGLSRYVAAKALQQSTGLASIQEGIFQELGLLDNLDALMKIETYWAIRLKREAKERQR